MIMPKQSFALEAGAEKRLEVGWKGMFKDTEVKFDGELIGTIPDQKALTKGESFELPDGTNISVQLIRKVFSTELQVLHDNQPLPGSASDPQTKLKSAYAIVFFIAGLNLVLGLVSVLFDVEILQQLGIGLGSIFFGLAFLVLGFFVKRKSGLALILAIVLFIFDSLLGLIFSVLDGCSPGVGGIIARILLLIPMFQGVGAIKALKKEN
jgi:hypothetical protein